MPFRMRFLVVDDERSVRKLCLTLGNTLGFNCSEAENAEGAMAQLAAEPVDMVLSDLQLPNKSGIELLRRIKETCPTTEVAIMTGHGSIPSAVQAMKLGAYDYIEKPFRLEQMKLFLERMADRVRLVKENEFLRARASTETELQWIVGTSSKIQDVMRMIGRLKDTRAPVLITGESGTGKELVARAVHFRGSFAHRPFVAVDCGALVPTLVESELFGYEKGAFTGAVKAKQGLFHAADGGTLFLDEVGELPLEMQTKLLRALQEKEVRPVGSTRGTKVDVRVIAATNRDLEVAYREGNFRKDLYFRLNVVSIHMPPLRERRSDIPALAHLFLDRYAPDKELQIAPEAMEALLQFDWPGNIRELENTIHRAVTLGEHSTLQVQDLPPALRGAQEPASEAEPATPAPASGLREIERVSIERVLREVQGDKDLACKRLGISRATLYRRLKQYNIAVPDGPMPSPAVESPPLQPSHKLNDTPED